MSEASGVVALDIKRLSRRAPKGGDASAIAGLIAGQLLALHSHLASGHELDLNNLDAVFDALAAARTREA